MNETIKCFIKEEVLRICLTEPLDIKVTVENGGEGGTINNLEELLASNILIEEVTSQIDGVKIDFEVTNNIYSLRHVFLNGLREANCTKVDDKLIRISPAPEIGDNIIIEYIKGE